MKVLAALVVFCILSVYPDAMAGSKTIRYVGAKVLRHHHFVEEDFWTKNGVIISPPALPNRPDQPNNAAPPSNVLQPDKKTEAYQVVHLEDRLIAPGYIDLQINGAFGVDFTHNPQELGKVAEQLTQYGVTAFLPTVISSTRESYPQKLQSLREAKLSKNAAKVLGLHLEGPFFSQNKRGAHPEKLMLGEVPDLETYYGGDLSEIKIITLAPELPGALNAIDQLTRKHGIVVSAGHTMATAEEIRKGVAHGLRLATHLRNAMPKPGQPHFDMVNEILSQEQMYFSMIVDGHHVSPEQVKADWKKAGSRLILVTDAMSGLGLPDGVYDLGDEKVLVEKGTAKILGTQTLAGSVLSLDQAVRNLLAFAGASPEEAIEAASLKPATLMGLPQGAGTLEPGLPADFIVLDRNLNVESTYLNGKEVFSKNKH